MWSISTRFAATLPFSHTVLQKVEILQDDDSVLVDLTDLGVVVDGSVSVSRSPIQRSARLTLVDRDGTLTPSDVEDILIPSGRQLRLWRGLTYVDATPTEIVNGTANEYVPLGTFRFTATQTTSGQIVLDHVYDRAWVVQGALFEDTFTIAAGTNVVDAIANVISTAYPGVPYNFPTVDEVTGLMTYDANADPWSVAQDLAANVGLRLFFDPLGVAQLKPEPDPTVDPAVWSFDDSLSDSMLLPDPTQTWSGECYNSVTVSGESTSLTAPVRATIRDLEPSSPTRYGGPFGKRPMPLIVDEKIASASQAEARALKELQAQLGISQQVNFTSWGHPALDTGDIVYVASAARGIAQYFILDTLEVPLRASQTMAITTRARQVVTIV
jgi:hypothetical protein